MAPGAVTDALVVAAAETFADLLTALPPDPVLLRLVPRTALAGGALDASLGAAVADRLRGTDWLPVAGRPGDRQRPDRAAVLDEATEDRVDVLGDVLPGLLPAGWSRRSDAPALAGLGVRRVGMAEAVEAVRGVQRPASWWARLYAALDGADREELAALPVPLVDGRTAHGPAGVLLPEPGLPGRAPRPAGPAAGAAAGGRPAGGAAAARAAGGAAGDRGAPCSPTPPSATAVESSMDAVDDPLDGGPDPEELARGVLDLVAAARPSPGDLPWLGELALPDAAGGWAPAGELVLPGSEFAAVLADGALGTLDPATAATCDPDALRAVGVLDTFALVSADDPDDLDVDAADRWVDAVLDRLPPDAPPPAWPPLVAVRDLELVRDWRRALPLLAATPAAARADVLLGGVPVPSYLRWWLSTHPVLDGARPDRLRHPDSVELQGLYEPAAGTAAVLHLLRPPATVDDVLADVDGAIDLLDRLGDPARTVRPEVLRTVHARLAAALDGVDVDPPDRVRVAPDRVVADAVVLDAPYLQPLVDEPVVPAGGAAGAVADLLDLPLASEKVRASVTGGGRRQRWAELPGAPLAAARLGVDGGGGRARRARAADRRGPDGDLVAGGGRRPRGRVTGRAGAGARLAGRRLAAAAGAGRGVRLSRPCRGAGRRGPVLLGLGLACLACLVGFPACPVAGPGPLVALPLLSPLDGAGLLALLEGRVPVPVPGEERENGTGDQQMTRKAATIGSSTRNASTDTAATRAPQTTPRIVTGPVSAPCDSVVRCIRSREAVQQAAVASVGVFSVATSRGRSSTGPDTAC